MSYKSARSLSLSLSLSLSHASLGLHPSLSSSIKLYPHTHMHYQHHPTSLLYSPRRQRKQKELPTKVPLSLPLSLHYKRGRQPISAWTAPCLPRSSAHQIFALSFFRWMDQNLNMVSAKSKKRTATEEAHVHPLFSLDELNQDLLERVLAWLPSSSFFRLRSVCKRWSSIAASATFQMACSQIPFRDPWFFMVNHELDQSIVYDTSERNWKTINHPILFHQSQCSNAIPVASSGGLVCFHIASGNFIVCNPVTGACRELPPAGPASATQSLHAIAMNSCSEDRSSYKIVLVFGGLANLAFKVFDSVKNQWQDEVPLIRKAENSVEAEMAIDDTVYFLSKAGDVVAPNMQRSPSKQYSSVFTMEDGEEWIYFLGHTGTVVACNLACKTFVEHPRLLPIYSEYSIDVVECKGEMLVVVLSELLETASLRVWKFCKSDQSWRQVASMPPSMSHDFYGKKVDVNCVGYGDSIFICITSNELSSCVMCNLVANEWIELPKYFVDGKAKEFMSAFSFEPRVEASV